jgi:hypothetical protein
MVETMDAYDDILRWADEPLKGPGWRGASYLFQNGFWWTTCELCGTGEMTKIALKSHLMGAKHTRKYARVKSLQEYERRRQENQRMIDVVSRR